MGILLGALIVACGSTARAEPPRARSAILAFLRFLPRVPVPPGPGKNEIIRPEAPRAGEAPTIVAPLPGEPTPAAPTTPAVPPALAPSALTPPTASTSPAAAASVSVAPSVVAPPVFAPPVVGPPVVASPVVAPLDVVTEIPPAVSVPRRPRFDVAVGMGGSFDSSGLVKGRTVLAPAFLVQAAVGDGPIGFAARLLSTQASGRFHQICNGVSDMPVDRLAIDLLFAIRPWAAGYTNDKSWGSRVARGLALNLGAGGENASVGQQSSFRIGIVVGAHVDLPLTPSGDATELRLRLGVRRMLAGEGTAGVVLVSDTSADVFGALAAVF